MKELSKINYKRAAVVGALGSTLVLRLIFPAAMVGCTTGACLDINIKVVENTVTASSGCHEYF